MHNPVKKKLARTFFLYFLFDSPHVFLFFVLGKGKEVGAFGWDLLSLKGEKGEKSRSKKGHSISSDIMLFSLFWLLLLQACFYWGKGLRVPGHSDWVGVFITWVRIESKQASTELSGLELLCYSGAGFAF